MELRDISFNPIHTNKVHYFESNVKFSNVTDWGHSKNTWTDKEDGVSLNYSADEWGRVFKKGVFGMKSIVYRKRYENQAYDTQLICTEHCHLHTYNIKA